MDDYNVMNQMYETQGVAYEAEPVGRYTAKTFGWMFLGLLVTFMVSMIGYITGAIIYVFMIPYAVFVLAIAEVAVVLFLSARINKMSVGAARGLLFLVAFWLFGMFINLAQFEMIACTAGIFIFLLFTAYDTQKIKAYHAAYSQNPEMAKKASIFSALQLYLDFINLFLYLLRVLGRRK